MAGLVILTKLLNVDYTCLPNEISLDVFSLYSKCFTPNPHPTSHYKHILKIKLLPFSVIYFR